MYNKLWHFYYYYQVNSSDINTDKTTDSNKNDDANSNNVSNNTSKPNNNTSNHVTACDAHTERVLWGMGIEWP